MIKPVNFTGIKNIGYAEVKTEQNDLLVTRNVLNMQLTDDENEKDLTEYKNILRDNPQFANKFGDEFINIEIKSAKNEFSPSYIGALLNGEGIRVDNEEGRHIFNFMSKLVNKVNQMKEKDFKVDKYYTASNSAYSGLVYNEDFDCYLDGTNGKLSLFDGTTLTEEFDMYLNTDNISDEDKTLTAIAAERVLETMYTPQWVKNGSHIMKAFFDIVTFKDLGS